MDLSICLLNWNTREDLRRCLQSLRASGCALEREIIVVDNASTDGSPEMVAREAPEVRLIVNDSNLGFAAGNNAALRASTGRYCLLLNPDTQVRPCALSSLVEALEAEPNAAAAGPKLLNGDGSIQYSCRRFPNFATGLFRRSPLGRFFPRNRFEREYLMKDWAHDRAREVDWISGAASCMRREALEQVGLLDERYYMFCEDVDWCLRARKLGWRIVYAPQAEIIHFRGRSTDLAPFRMAAEFHRSMERFYWKHYASSWPGALRWLPPLAIRLRLLFALGEHGLNWWRGQMERRM
jgi:hypothetical protein